MKFLLVTRKQITVFICVILAAVVFTVGSVSVFANTDKKLPIYCVECEKKQIAISFDAAWGNTKKVQTIRLL